MFASAPCLRSITETIFFSFAPASVIIFAASRTWPPVVAISSTSKTTSSGFNRPSIILPVP